MRNLRHVILSNTVGHTSFAYRLICQIKSFFVISFSVNVNRKYKCKYKYKCKFMYVTFHSVNEDAIMIGHTLNEIS